MGGGGGDGSQDPQIPAWWEVPDSHPKEASDALEASWVGLEESSLSADGQGDLMPRGLQRSGLGVGTRGLGTPAPLSPSERQRREPQGGLPRPPDRTQEATPLPHLTGA